jgi:hypothetical protein
MKQYKQRHGATILQSIHTAQVSSVPKAQRSTYLELYVLGRERSRLMQEMKALDARREVIAQHLKNISKQIGSMQQDVAKEQQEAAGVRIPSQPVKTVDISY